MSDEQRLKADGWHYCLFPQEISIDTGLFPLQIPLHRVLSAKDSYQYRVLSIKDHYIWFFPQKDPHQYRVLSAKDPNHYSSLFETSPISVGFFSA